MRLRLFLGFRLWFLGLVLLLKLSIIRQALRVQRDDTESVDAVESLASMKADPARVVAELDALRLGSIDVDAEVPHARLVSEAQLCNSFGLGVVDFKPTDLATDRF